MLNPKGDDSMVEQDTIKLLRECDAGVKMGTASIDDVLDHVKGADFKQKLIECKQQHNQLQDEIQKLLRELAANGQIATQYVDLSGNASMDMRFNPNASYFAIEGITSPDGRVLGKMGHTERSGENLYKNVPGDKYQPLFEGGVDYFK